MPLPLLVVVLASSILWMGLSVLGGEIAFRAFVGAPMDRHALIEAAIFLLAGSGLLLVAAGLGALLEAA